MAATALKLRANDLDDMRVLAAFLQDALVPVIDIAFQRDEQRFVLVANRFRWETQDAGNGGLGSSGGHGDAPVGAESADPDARFQEGADGPRYERVNSGVRFGNVTAVQVRGIDLRMRDQILSLLTVDATAEAITLLFSGEGAIRLQVSGIDCYLEDIGEPWPTPWRPIHKLDAADLDG